MVLRYNYDKCMWLNENGITTPNTKKTYIHNTWINGIHYLYVKLFRLTIELKI